MYDASGRAALDASQSLDAGNYGRAVLAFNASVMAFDAAVVSDLFLRRRHATGADLAMMACPIDIPGAPGAGAALSQGERAAAAAAEAGGGRMVGVEQAARLQRQALFDHLAEQGSFEQGRHGEASSRVGAELIRMSKEPGNLPEYNSWLRRLGKEELEYGRGVNHR
jgi:hypothetical protein